MTLQQRVESYAAIMRQFPSSVPHVSPDGRWLSAVWLLGNAYKGSGYYGAYPPSYLRRVAALFPDVAPERWLHLFSGSLDPSVPGVRVDMRPPGDGVASATVRADAKALPFRTGRGYDRQQLDATGVADTESRGQREQRRACDKGDCRHTSFFWPARPGETQATWEPPRVVRRIKSGLGVVPDGLPAGLVRHRRRALAALGNAIVPQVAEVIARRILEMEARKELHR